jgi:anti-sigma factor RsiW
MDCRETRALVHGYVDGELDLMRGLEIERHFEDCADCAQLRRNLATMQIGLRSRALYRSAPPGLERRIRSAVKREACGRRIWTLPWRALAGVAAVAALLLLVWLLPRPGSRAGDDALVREVVAGQVRSLMADHLADVASTDRHTVKPWFNGKLDFSPPVVDLKDEGFPLVGGRLDYLDGRPVAALVYKRNRHTINLFVWPNAGGAESDSPAVKRGPEATRQGYNLVHWNQAGMHFWAVSDLNTTELDAFALHVRAEARGADGGR